MLSLRHALAASLVLMLGATACAATDVAGGGEPPVAVDAPAPGGAPIPVEPDGGIGDGAGAPPGGADHGAAKKVQPYEGEVIDVRARPWDQVVANDDQTELTVFWYSGVEPCVVLDRVEVATSQDAVTITVFEGRPADQPDAMCIEIAESHAYTVELGEPLGPRSIVDGSLR